MRLTDAEGETLADHEALAGRVFESLEYDGSTVIGGTRYTYWKQRTAAGEDLDGGGLDHFEDHGVGERRPVRPHRRPPAGYAVNRIRRRRASR